MSLCFALSQCLNHDTCGILRINQFLIKQKHLTIHELSMEEMSPGEADYLRSCTIIFLSHDHHTGICCCGAHSLYNHSLSFLLCLSLSPVLPHTVILSIFCLVIIRQM